RAAALRDGRHRRHGHAGAAGQRNRDQQRTNKAARPHEIRTRTNRVNGLTPDMVKKASLAVPKRHISLKSQVFPGNRRPGALAESKVRAAKLSQCPKPRGLAQVEQTLI